MPKPMTERLQHPLNALSGRNRTSVSVHSIAKILVIILIFLTNAQTWAMTSDIPTQSLKNAQLSSLAGVRDVQLSHVPESTDFPAEGGTVRYLLNFDLNRIPDMPLGIYIPKISLSGKVYLNGQWVATCGNAQLEDLRCLHQPQFYRVPGTLFRQGKNALTIEVYATSRQTNGLSVVHLGEANAVYENMYSWMYFLTAELQMGLIYLSGLLGVAALIASRILRKYKSFIWYGSVCLLHAVASLIGVVTNPPVDIDFFNWLIFSSRFGFLVFAYISLLSIFKGKNSSWIKILLWYFAFALIAIYFSANNRYVVVALYSPLAVIGGPILYTAARGILKMKNNGYLFSIFILFMVFCGGVFDFYRLAANHVFNGIYVSVYTNGFALVLIGLILIYRITTELVDSQNSVIFLQQQADHRSAFELTKYIPVGTYTMRLDPGEIIAKYTFLSQRFLDLTGLDQELFYHNPVHAFDCLHPEDREAWIQLQKKSFETKSTFIQHARFIVNDQVRWVVAESIARQIFDGSTIWEGVLTDETSVVIARQKAEQDRITLQMYLMEKSRLEEREQLLRDVHDGFGSQLASVRMMVERGYVQPSKLNYYLQELSADLHLVVDTLGQSDITLEEAFYGMRYRIDRYFANSNISFEWLISLEKLPVVDSRSALQIQRIIQEAINNAVRHAKAKSIGIKAIYDSDNLFLSISVSDDGIGIPQTPRRGRGIANMRHRARTINSRIEIMPRHPGTEVLLIMKFTLD